MTGSGPCITIFLPPLKTLTKTKHKSSYEGKKRAGPTHAKSQASSAIPRIALNRLSCQGLRTSQSTRCASLHMRIRDPISSDAPEDRAMRIVDVCIQRYKNRDFSGTPLGMFPPASLENRGFCFPCFWLFPGVFPPLHGTVAGLKSSRFTIRPPCDRHIGALQVILQVSLQVRYRCVTGLDHLSQAMLMGRREAQ